MRISSVSFETKAGDQILLSASGLHTDPVRVLLMTEVDYAHAMRSGTLSSKSQAMPILSADVPSVTLTMPTPGQWRIVYETADADSVSVVVNQK